MTLEEAKDAFRQGKPITVGALGDGKDMPFGKIAELPRETEKEMFMTRDGVIVTEQLVKVEGNVRLYKRHDLGRRKLVVPLSRVYIW